MIVIGSENKINSYDSILVFLLLMSPFLEELQKSPDAINKRISSVANRPFPSSPGPLFQNEGRCSAFDMEIIFHSRANKTHFHKKGLHLASF